MKNFTKGTFIICLLCTIIMSCSKSNTDTSSQSYYIKAKFNGELKTFTKLIGGKKSMVNGNLVHLVLGGVETNSSNFSAYDIEIWNLSGNIQVGTYAENVYPIQSRYATGGFTRFSNFANSINDFVVKISSIPATEIKGTFEGTITHDSQNINLTGGEFHLPLKD